MRHIRELTRYQKGILIFLILTVLFFTVLYAVTASRVGYAYHGQILTPGEENGATVYTGKLQEQDTVLTVSGHTVTLQFGNQRYGPYTVREDPTAIPKDVPFTGPVTGLEIRRGEDLYFRGAKESTGTHFRLVSEDGKAQASVSIIAGLSSYRVDAYGNQVQVLEPSPGQILDLLEGPELTHKGSWGGWLCGLLVSLLTAAYVFFADSLFRLRMFFHLQDAQAVEPSEWVLGARYATWFLLCICTLWIFIANLQ